MNTVHLLDYGVGNIGSVSALFESLGHIAILTSDPVQIRESPLVVLPGVGSARTAMRQLEAKGLLAPLRERSAGGRAIVGICLGAQLLFSQLEEADGPGLGLLEGRVSRRQGQDAFNTGWCALQWPKETTNGFATGLRPTDTFFFNHQYVCPREQLPDCVTVVGDPATPAIYFTPRLCGIQFHPEKSQQPGRLLMRNILRHYHGS